MGQPSETGSTSLREFVAAPGALTLDDRRALVQQALVLIEQNYVHLPLKTAMYAVNPVQRLRLLAHRLSRRTEADMGPEWAFHAELSEIFHSVRDLHTNYLLPPPYGEVVAYLPFLIEEYYEGTERHYIVTATAAGFSADGFRPGVEVTHWNGIPIDRAVGMHAARYAGGNPAARHAQGLASLTIRPLILHTPPEEAWVVLGYLGADGRPRELRQEWRVARNLPAFVDAGELSRAAVAQALDLGTDEISRARAMLFAPAAVTTEETVTGAALTAEPAGPGEEIPTRMPRLMRARSVVTSSGTFGHLRIFSFNVNDPAKFAEEFVRLLGLLPQEGLILDVRGNGGGHIHAAEFLLQTLTPRPITPAPAQFVTTPLNALICRRHKGNPTGHIDLSPWCPSMDLALETGADYSAAFPLTPPEGANAIGQRYHGPVVLITDARCYSATDIFAAGFADHGIGEIIGVDDNTGAGGANVWDHALLHALLQLPSPAEDSPYRPLPGGAGLRVAIRRFLRVGELAGTPLEDLGVQPHHRHRMTRDDVLHGNVDLLEKAGRLLAARPVRALVPSIEDEKLTLRVRGLDRADVYLDGRPRVSADLTGETTALAVPGLDTARVIRIEGYAAGEFVASRTLVR